MTSDIFGAKSANNSNEIKSQEAKEIIHDFQTTIHFAKMFQKDFGFSGCLAGIYLLCPSKMIKKSNINSNKLKLFKTLSQIRTKNGLIFNDFERYNNYLSRRIYAIRRKLKFHGGMKSKSYSYRTPSKQQQQLTDIRILHLPLLMSERCLARSHILRSSDQDSVNKFRAAHHSISRLAKSVVFSQRLVNVCDIANCPPMSKLEARAYLDYNIAHCKFEKRKFDEAFRHYKESKQALKSLRTHSIDNEDTKKFLSDQIATIDERLYECMYLLGGTVDNQDSDHEMLCEGDLQSHENDESVNYFEPYKKDVYRPILLQNMLDSLETITDDSTHSEFEKLLKRSDLLIHHNTDNKIAGALLYCKFLKAHISKQIIRNSQTKLLKNVGNSSPKDLKKIFKLAMKLSTIVQQQMNMIQNATELPTSQKFLHNLREEQKLYEISQMIAMFYAFANYYRFHATSSELESLANQITLFIEKRDSGFENYKLDPYINILQIAGKQVISTKRTSKNLSESRENNLIVDEECMNVEVFWPLRSDLHEKLQYSPITYSESVPEDQDNKTSVLGSIFSWFSGSK